MSKMKDKSHDTKQINTKRSKKCCTARNIKTNGVVKDVQLEIKDKQSDEKKSPNILLTDEINDEDSFLKSCEENISMKLTSALSGFTKHSISSYPDGEEIRKKLQEEKCVSKASLENIKLFFADVQNHNEISGSRFCSLASKYLRIFIDILEVSTSNQMEFVIQACDLVITIHQYFFLKDILVSLEKFIVMLHHVMKQLHKKQHISGIVVIIKDVMHFLRIAVIKNILFHKDSKNSFCIMHQMCYSLYYKELQKHIQCQNKNSDITSYFDLRISSLIVLAFSGWNENKFIDHFTNFINNESIILAKSCVYDKEIISGSILELLSTLYKLIELESVKQNDCVKSLLQAARRLAYFYVSFCTHNGLQKMVDEFFLSIPEKLKTTHSVFYEGMMLLQKSFDLNKLMNQCCCVCSSKDIKLATKYPLLIKKYFDMFLSDKSSDGSWLYDILKLTNLKDLKQICGSVINILMEVILIAIRILLNTLDLGQKHNTSSLLTFLRGLLVQIQSHLFPDSDDGLQCYTNEEVRCNFDLIYNEVVKVLPPFLEYQKNDTNRDNFKWLHVLCKIGIHYYHMKQFDLAVPSLQFTIFLNEFWIDMDIPDISFLKDFLKKYNLLAECYFEIGKFEECYQTYVKSIQHFGRMSPEDLRVNKSLLEIQVTYWVKKKLLLSNETVQSSKYVETSILDAISSNENSAFLSLVLDVEFYAHKKLGEKNNCAFMKRLYTLRKDYYGREGDVLKLASSMIEMSACSSFSWEERDGFCSEAVGLVEEYHSELKGTGDQFEWHAHDVLAVGFFQQSVLRYEKKVAESIENIGQNMNDLEVGTIGKEYHHDCLLEEDYIDKQFITSLNSALDLWTEITQRSLEGDLMNSCLSIFYNAESSANCLHHAAVFYSLLSQNLNSVKASYLSGLVYQMLSKENDEYKEKQVEAWVLTASQFLLIKNVRSGEKVLEELQNIANCSIFSKLHIDVLKAASLLYSGNIQSSAETFNRILDNDVLNDNTKSALIIKSDIYFLLSDLKLITVEKEENGEISAAKEQHFPSMSPFPPISDCLRYLRSLYSKYVDQSCTQGADITLSSNWAYLDKLLICLTRHAELLKHQGSILEAKSLLKEALLLTQKYHLTLRTVDILQQLASLDLIVDDESSFNATFSAVTKILQPTVHGCLNISHLLAPDFIEHSMQCSCNYCLYAKLQEIHIILYLQFIEGKQRFSQLTSDEYDASVKVIDTLVENAYERHITSLKDVYKITDMDLTPCNQMELKPEVSQQVLKKGKRTVSKKKTKPETFTMKSGSEDKESFNLFMCYSLEAKINKSVTENKNMTNMVEQLILKVEMCDSFHQTHHKYHRLIAQLYRLRSLLSLGVDMVEKVWFCQRESESSNGVLNKDLITPKTPLPTKHDRKKASSTKKIDCNLVTDETPRPGRKVKRKPLRKGRLNVAPNETREEDARSIGKITSVCLDESSLVKCLEDLQKSLSVLNPYTDVLIIKGIYQILLLLSGTWNKDLTTACLLLSSSRTLHQQILSSYGKKLRDRMPLAKAPLNDGVLETTSNLLEKYSGPKLVFDHGSVQHLVKDYVPHDWCICSLSLAEFQNKRFLIICRLQGLAEPTIMKIDLVDKPQYNKGSENVVCDLAAAFDEADLLEKFDSLIAGSQESMKVTDKSLWWAERVKLDKELKSNISRLEDEWLQGWKGMLLGQYKDNEMVLSRIRVAEEVAELICSSINRSVDKVLIECLVDGFQYCTKYQIVHSLQTLFGEDAEAVYEIFVQCLERNEYGSFKDDTVEDKGALSSARKPVVLILDKTLQKLPWESLSIFRDQPVTRMPSFLMTSSHCKNYQDLIVNGVKLEKCCYILNPKNDLKRTEEKFTSLFQSKKRWHGIVGRAPTQAEYSDAISENDLFIYCGHGSGQEYLGWSAVHRLQSSAISLLMGCSSGKLMVQGELEAQGMVLHYLSAGCPSVVANLWHVTDKDIDLFLEKLLELWMSEEQCDIAECVAKARHACKLKYLNGAAPVVYGIPLFINKDI